MDLYDKWKRRKMWQNILIVGIIVILVMLLSVFCLFLGIRHRGKEALEASGSCGQSETETQLEESSSVLSYDGENYEYRKNLLTFLVLGIDDYETVSPAVDGISGGQSDAMFLVVVDLDREKISVIAINRNAMVTLDVYDRAGEYMYQWYGQITLQHGYGDGMEISCERTARTVSRLFYQIPINGYFSVNMGAIGAINDAVGGVELVSMDDFYFPDFTPREGETIRLEGMQAYYYLKYRDITVFESSSERLERQKQYLSAFAKQVLEKTKRNIAFPLKLYQEIEPYVVTNLDSSEMIYLASEVAGYDFDDVEILSVPGETVMGEQFEEFYIDEDAFYQMVLSVFYEKADEEIESLSEK